jgi:hypothetical protein
MSVPQAGLILCQQTRPNGNDTYYLKKGDPIVDPVLEQPVVIQPLYIESTDETTTATLFVSGATAGAYQGAINIQPGVNASSTLIPGDGITVRTVAGPSTVVDVGANAQAAAILNIAGPSGTSQVYDGIYNPVIKSTAVASSTGALPQPGGFGFNYTPTKTGAYLLQVNINVRNADQIPLVGFIEWGLSDGAEVQYAGNTINSNALIKVAGMDEINGLPGGIAEPTDFTSSNLVFLTAGVPVLFSITTARDSTIVGSLAWAIQNYDARLIQMC